MKYKNLFILFSLLGLIFYLSSLDAMNKREEYNYGLDDDKALILAIENSKSENYELPSVPSEEDLFDERLFSFEKQPSAPGFEIDDKKYSVYLEEECAICLEPFENLYEDVGILECKHMFCKACTVNLKNDNAPCPFCRKEIDKINYTLLTNVKPIVSKKSEQKQPHISKKLSQKTKRKLLDLERKDRREIVLENFKRNHYTHPYSNIEKAEMCIEEAKIKIGEANKTLDSMYDIAQESLITLKSLYLISPSEDLLQSIIRIEKDIYEYHKRKYSY